MKIQHLTVIFILIIMPIVIVFSEYLSSQVSALQMENRYNMRLLNSTYDTVKTYQLNTINNATSDRPYSKVADIEAAANTFLNSIATSFKYDGYNSEVMQQYIPAIVFTLYDGYYIYSPLTNTLTNRSTKGEDESQIDVSEEYRAKIQHGLKPYIYYTNRYKFGTDDFIITYTLDNYITIEGKIKGKYVYDFGYLMTGITRSGTAGNYKYQYDGIEFKEDDTEALKEYVGKPEPGNEYYYVKIDGTKFYYDASGETQNIFYINEGGTRTKQVSNVGTSKKEFELYYNAIFHNKSAFLYYQEAYNFTDRVLNTYGLKNLKVNDSVDEYFRSSDMLIFDKSIPIQNSTSNFNSHRAEVIKRVVEQNLEVAISQFANYSSVKDFIMPKISDKDWNLIANNVCVAAFLQGMPIGGKIFNSYAVTPNNINKEYVDENDIYILVKDSDGKDAYCRANDTNVLGPSSSFSIKNDLEYFPGIFKISFQRKLIVDDHESHIYYSPLSNYMGSYTSIVGSSGIFSVSGSTKTNDLLSLENGLYRNRI